MEQKIEILQKQSTINVQEKADLIWSIADKLRGIYKPHEYGNAIFSLDVKTSKVDRGYPHIRKSTCSVKFTKLSTICEKLTKTRAKAPKTRKKGKNGVKKPKSFPQMQKLGVKPEDFTPNFGARGRT